LIHQNYPDDENWQVSSAGIEADECQPATLLAQEVLAVQDLSLQEHRSTSITPERMNAAHLVLVMTNGHKKRLEEDYPSLSDRIFLLSEMVGELFDIADPYGEGRGAYQACAALISELLETGFHRILEKAALNDRLNGAG
jgi:protein-tyrosine phosphatase